MVKNLGTKKLSVRSRVLRSHDRFWRVEDFEGDAKAVDMSLRRLAEAGQLERVRRGVYWRGRSTRFGRAIASPIEAVREVVGGREAIGAAEWYATNLLGLSTQVSPTPTIAVTRRTPTGIDDVRLINRASRTGRRDAALSDLEVTVLEALDGWDRYVEVDARTATDRFVHILRGNDVRVERLVRAAGTESSRVRERLRFVLERAGLRGQASRIAGARTRAGRDSALAVVAAAS
jgi:hypothetical protein